MPTLSKSAVLSPQSTAYLQRIVGFVSELGISTLQSCNSRITYLCSKHPLVPGRETLSRDCLFDADFVHPVQGELKVFVTQLPQVVILLVILETEMSCLCCKHFSTVVNQLFFSLVRIFVPLLSIAQFQVWVGSCACRDFFFFRYGGQWCT